MSWPQVALGEAADIVGGSTPSSSLRELWDGGIAWATPTDLSVLTSKFIDRTERTISPAGLQSCAAKVLPPNSVLFSSRAPIGLVAINKIPMATNQGFKSFIPKPDRTDAKFLYWWLRANRPFLESLGNGATFKEVSKAIVSRIEIPQPPLAEQRRIAAVLDRAEALRAKRRAALAQLDILTQSIFIDVFGDPATNPKGWPVLQLHEVVKEGTIVTYGIVQAGEEFPGGVPYIRTGDIVGGEIVTSGLRHTDPEIAAKFSRSRVEAGDIVMSIRATVGTTALVPRELDGANLTQGTGKISPGKKIERFYLLNYLRASGTQHWIRLQIKGATFREITLTRLRELPVAVPPIATQREFARAVKAIEKLKTAHSASLAELASLFASLQHRAFRGEL